MSVERRSCICNVFDSVLDVDLFAKTPQLTLPSGRKKYNSCIGCMLTVIYVAVLAALIYFLIDERLDINANTHSSQTMVPSPWNEKPGGDILLAFALVDPYDPSVTVPADKLALLSYVKYWNYDLSKGSTPMQMFYRPIENAVHCSKDSLD